VTSIVPNGTYIVCNIL